MGTAAISIAETPDDIAAVKQLCRDFVTWLHAAHPEQRENILIYFEPVKWERTLAELPEIHARPDGAMLLARLDGVPVGCIMYHKIDQGIAEVKRLFVANEARGKGIASRLVEVLIESAQSDGYEELRLDTTTFLSEAERLYRKHGFVDSTHSIELAEEALDVVVFMHRTI